MSAPCTPAGGGGHAGAGEAASPPHTAEGDATIAPYHMSPGVSLHTGDALAVLRCLPTASADCVVTAPPPWTPRDDNTGTWAGCGPSHGHAPPAVVPGNRRGESAGCAAAGPSGIDSTGYDSSPGPSPSGSVRARRPDTTAVSAGGSPFGLEPTAAGYVDRLRAVFAEFRRVLAPTGTAWLNLGDSYSATSGGDQYPRPGQTRHPDCRAAAGVPLENLLGLPWRVALALQADGWVLRNAVAWHTPSGATPTPADGRLAARYQMLFLLAAQQRYFFDLDPIREPYTGDRALARRAHRGGTTPHAARGARSPWPPPARPGRPGGVGRGRNPGDVWAIPTQPAHSGRTPVFPVEVARRCVAAGCPPGGVVLDPFSGTGTTGLAARQLGRSYVGIDPDPAHHDRAVPMLQQACHPDRCGTPGTDPDPGTWSRWPGRPGSAAVPGVPDLPGGAEGRWAA